MRKILGLFVCVVLLVLTGCANPIASVQLTANVDGTFGVDVVFKDGSSVNLPSVSPGQLAVLSKRYNIRMSQVVTRQAAAPSPCEVVNLPRTTFAIQTRPDSMKARIGRAFGAGCACDSPAVTVIPSPDTTSTNDPVVWGPTPVDPSAFKPAAQISLEARVNALEAKMDRVLAIAEKLNK